MARVAQDKAYRSFRNGLVTEVTGLTFPPDSCRDINNCDINVDGSVRRRYGLTEESGGFQMEPGCLADLVWEDRPAGPFSYRPYPGAQCLKSELAVTVHLWPAPGGQSDLAFVIFQVGNKLFIRNWMAETISDPGNLDQYIGGSLVLELDYETDGLIYRTNYLDAAKVPLQSSVGTERIWFTSEAVVPFYLEYDIEARVLRGHPVGYDENDPNAAYGKLSMRDFNGIEDGLKPDEQPTTLSDEHRYNLYNQGWTDDLINDYQTSQSKYPSNAQQWVWGKDENEDFDPDLLAKQDFGTSMAPRGRAIIGVLTGNRDFIFPNWDEVNEYDDPSSTSFRTCAFYAGRLWLAGDANKKRPSAVYFSKVIIQPKDAGLMMQENDPTSEHFSDLLATDGGVIPVPEASGIMKLLPFGAGLLVLARNGIWFIYGASEGFKADSYSVEKVSSTGILSASSMVEADQQVVFFAQNSIHAIVFPENGIIPTVIDIAQDKIHTAYNEVPIVARAQAQACYDTRSKKIFWSWLQLVDGRYHFPIYQFSYNRMFVLDTRTGAFSKYTFKPDEGQFLVNGAMFPKRQASRPSMLDYVVTDEDGQVLVGTEEVITFRNARATDQFINSVKVLFLDGVNECIRIMEFYDTAFVDYQTIGVVPTYDYDSFVVTGDEVLEDLQREKQATYLHSFFRKTETGMQVGTDGSLIFENPSGCTVEARWDWHKTAAGGRWSRPQQAYRYRRPFQPEDVEDDVDTGDGIVYTRLKIRGHGRSLALKYSSQSGKDFQLLGYSIPFTANGA